MENFIFCAVFYVILIWPFEFDIDFCHKRLLSMDFNNSWNVLRILASLEALDPIKTGKLD